MSFADRLDVAAREHGNPCLVGLDPHLDLLPGEFARARDPQASAAERAGEVQRFLLEALELVAGRVPAVKPQSAFFEVLGAEGVRAFERVCAEARRAGLLVIGDVKRGDIASTARAYAEAFLAADAPARCDAITVNPWLGSDSVEPFLEVCEREQAGVFVLVRTSNPGSAIFQEHGAPPLTEVVAGEVARWGSRLVGTCGLSSVGAVVGATHPRELARLRALMPHAPLLVPGYGAQGAGAAEVAAAFLPNGRGALVNSSRGVLFAHARGPHAGLPWKDALRKALDEMIAELGAVAAGAGKPA